MTSYLSATIAAARNDELQRRAARGLPLLAYDAARSNGGYGSIRRYFRHASEAYFKPLRREGRGARGARASAA
jgi:hypothetical protein